VTKSEITLKLADQFNLPPRQARLIVDSFFMNVLKGVLSGEKVILRGFGTFSVKVVRARLRRNPQTGEILSVGERHSLAFKSGKALHERLNRNEQCQK